MSVTTPKGFRAAGIAAGIKKSNNKDLALVVNDGPMQSVAAVFTSNRVKAAPVKWSANAIKDGRLKAVVLNSGGANACTGVLGEDDARMTAERAAKTLDMKPNEIALCSTGLIGERLPMGNLLAGLEIATSQLSVNGGSNAAHAIMTTDKVSKTVVINKDGYCIGGMAKGAGMLAPALATMLVVLTTDAVVDSQSLDAVLRRATSRTFDRLDSDGCMSTNDTVLLMASGASGVKPDIRGFAAAVEKACMDLAMQLMSDAEGSTKDIEITVQNALTEEDALIVGKQVARSNLFKCAMHGEDPNWGRVISAVGTTEAAFDPDRIAVAINDVWICRDGAAGEDRTKVDMKDRRINVTIDLNAGDASVALWTNDLTADYVHENSAYSS